MRSDRVIGGFSAAFAVAVLLAFGAASGVAQGKHGGHGDHGGGNRGERGDGNRGGDGGWGRDGQDGGPGRGNGKNRGGRDDGDVRKQVQAWQNARREQGRQQQWQQRQQQQAQSQQEQRWQEGRRDQRDDQWRRAGEWQVQQQELYRRQRQLEQFRQRRQIYQQPQVDQPRPSYDGYRNYGQFRKARNQERKFERDEFKQERGFERDDRRIDGRLQRGQWHGDRRQRYSYGYPNYSYPRQYQQPVFNYPENRSYQSYPPPRSDGYSYPNYQQPRGYSYAYPNHQPPVNYGHAYPSDQFSPPSYGPYQGYAAPSDQYYSFGGPEYYGGQRYDPYYRSGNYNDYGSGDWKETLLRTVISAFLSNGSDQYFGDLYSPLSELPYNDAAYEDYPYYAAADGPVVTPQYSAYGSSPYYGGYAYDPYDNVLSPADYDGGDTDELTRFADLYTGGLGSELLARALGTGYYQGLLEGRYARRNGYARNDTHVDPYSYYGYRETAYDPYSESLGDCRRMFSEGYELGYQDALDNHRGFSRQADEGDVDLVSLLIGSALSLRG